MIHRRVRGVCYRRNRIAGGRCIGSRAVVRLEKSGVDSKRLDGIRVYVIEAPVDGKH